MRVFKVFSCADWFKMPKRKAKSDESDSDQSASAECDTQSDLEDSDYDYSSDDVSEEEFSLSEEDEGNENDVPILDEPFDMPWTENGIPRPPFPYIDTDGPQVPINI